MPDPTDRHPDNAPGPVYVDRSCIWCSACVMAAPDHFEERGDQVICIQQPDHPEAWEACRQAACACPVEAIGLGTEDPHQA
ncbi:MAG: ferredoxin [Myxococcota bacterium]